MSLQMEEIAVAAKVKFPEHIHVFLFDWSCCHDALQPGGFRCSKFKQTAGFQETRGGDRKDFNCDDLVLQCNYPAAKIDFKEGAPGDAPYGVQRVPFSAGEKPFYTYSGDTTDFTGQPKGLRQLVWERGLWKDGMTKTGGDKGEDFSVNATLESQPDVVNQRTVLEEVLAKYDNMEAVMIPKYHCELNGIERVWGSKFYTRCKCKYSFPDLMKNVPVSLLIGNIPVSMHRKFARKARDYVRAYAQAHGEDGAADQVSKRALTLVKEQKRYHSHRGVPPHENAGGHVQGRRPWAKKRDLLALRS